MDKPQTTLTLDLVAKTATITGDNLAIGETADVIIVNAESADGDTLVLSLIRRRRTLATCESFTLNAPNLEGVIDLNTSPMLREFKAASRDSSKQIQVTLWDDTIKRLLLNDEITVYNNPYKQAGDEEAGTVLPPVLMVEYSLNGVDWQDTPTTPTAYIRFSRDNGATWDEALISGPVGPDGTPAPETKVQYSNTGSTWTDAPTSSTKYIRFSTDDGATWCDPIYLGNNPPASMVSVDSSGFSGNLSPSDDDVQTALATMDAMTKGTEYYDYAATTYEELRDAAEGGAYASIWAANGAYTVTDDEARPITVHANCKLIHGESAGNVIIDADGNTNTNIQAVLYGHDELVVKNLKIIGQTSGSGCYAFQGQISYRVGVSASVGDANKATRFVNCQVATPDGAGNQLAFGFASASCVNCHVNGNSLISGYTGCCDAIQCILTLCHNIGFYQCEKLAACVATDSVSKGFLQCRQLVDCRAFTTNIGFEDCHYMSACESRIASIWGFNTCSNMSACHNVYAASIGFRNCTVMGYDCTDSGSSPIAFSGCSFVPSTFRDPTDNTKRATHDYSGIATGTERTYAWPNKDGTVAMLSDITGGGGGAISKYLGHSILTGGI